MPTTYDWKKTATKALKTAAVAGAAYFLAQPDIGPALMGAIPAQYQAIAVMLIPALITAARNWLKNQG